MYGIIKKIGQPKIDSGLHIIVMAGGASLLGAALFGTPGILAGAILGFILGFATKEK